MILGRCWDIPKMGCVPISKGSENQSIKDMEQYIEDLGKKVAQKQKESSGEESEKVESNKG